MKRFTIHLWFRQEFHCNHLRLLPLKTYTGHLSYTAHLITSMKRICTILVTTERIAFLVINILLIPETQTLDIFWVNHLFCSREYFLFSPIASCAVTLDLGNIKKKESKRNKTTKPKKHTHQKKTTSSTKRSTRNLSHLVSSPNPSSTCWRTRVSCSLSPWKSSISQY